MPQFRQDFITKEWVIVAPERAKRPDQFKQVRQITEKPEHDPKCPFCSGNENMTPTPVFMRGDPANWRLRVVPNKFAAVDPNISSERRQDGFFLSAGGFGIAEVVIESPKHNLSLGLMPHEDIRNVLGAYKSRYTDLSLNKNIDLITIFRNHGAKAGTSLEHPHSQIIATPIVPPHLRNLTQQARIYHDSYGKCPFCVLLEKEIENKERIVLEGGHHVVLCPFASRVPFEMKIYPKRHYSRLDGISPDEIDDLAFVLGTVLKKMHTGLSDPDYNFVVRTSPASDGELFYDHWSIAITPRITTAAGFEIGSGIFINSMPPEDAAAFLRGVKAA